MESTEKKNLPIDQMEFFSPNEEEAKLIADFSQNAFTNGFKKRIFISTIIAIFIILFDSLGRINLDTQNTIPGMILIVVFVLILFNILSFVYYKVKINMNDLLNKYQCVEAVVSEKYSSKFISRKGTDNIPDYILFDTGDIHCVTAIPTKDKDVFLQAEVGTDILIIKMFPMGNVRYSFILKPKEGIHY